MGTRTDIRSTGERELPRDTRAETILEFFDNDEQEAHSDDDVVLSHQGAMPAVQEFLQEMSELDLPPAGTRWH
jgi:hypothetical protein